MGFLIQIIIIKINKIFIENHKNNQIIKIITIIKKQYHKYPVISKIILFLIKIKNNE